MNQSILKDVNQSQKPNIVFILIDDMGWMDLGCYGSSFYETPNIDRLAENGMRFTNAYAACPVCSPTRASFMSGKYPATVGVTDWIDHGNYHPCKGILIDVPYIKELPLKEYSLANALRDGGYTTWHIGKWHLGLRDTYPDRHGFDVNIGGCSWGHPSHGYFSPYGIETLDDGPVGEYLTDRLTDEAIHLIQQSKDEPFFLNLWHYTVHTPLQAKDYDIEKFRAKAKNMGIDSQQVMVEGEFFPMENKKDIHVIRRIMQSDPVYAAMIANLDWNIGRLLETLEQTGKLNNTFIIFTSDNGGLSTSEGSPTCNFPLSEGKGWMAEGGIREPFIAYWPGVIKPDCICTEPITSPDLYPTLLEAAGLPLLPDQHVDGESFLHLMKDETAAMNREAIFWHYPHYGNQGSTPGSAMRMGDWKLIEYFDDGRVELYNLKVDISENNDLAPSNPGLTKELHDKLKAWRMSVKAKIPERNIKI